MSAILNTYNRKKVAFSKGKGSFLYGTNGKIKILEPWLPQKKSAIEVYKNNQIQIFNIESKLSPL